jgi:hypothetical protein
MFIYPIYYHNWKNISTIYVYITRLASKEIFSPSNKIHREVGWAKDLLAPRYVQRYIVARLLKKSCHENSTIPSLYIVVGVDVAVYSIKVFSVVMDMQK